MTNQPLAGPLMIIGGNEDKEGPRDILRTFIALSGGPSARIAIMTVATRHPQAAADRYLHAFGALGVREMYPVDIIQPADADSSGVHGLLQWATGVFFTGGSQYRLAAYFGGTGAFDLLLRRWRTESLVVAGTSAWANAAPAAMVVQGASNMPPRRSLAEFESGLGLLNSVLIESHFNQRGRLGRLLTALAAHPDHLGLGLDEDTAILVRGDVAHVLGTGALTILDPRTATHLNYTAIADDHSIALTGLTFHTLPHGYGFNLATRTPIPPNS